MKKSILYFVLAALFVACATEKIAVEEFAPYIAAYSGGIQKADASITVELTEPSAAFSNEEVKGLFRFSPSIKGKTFWKNDRTVEFVPDAGALKKGTTYEVKFRLDKVNPKVEKRLKTFTFNFMVEEQDYNILLLPLKITNSKNVTLEGQLSFNQSVTLEQVKQAMEISGYSGVKYQPTVEMLDERNFRFEIDSIERQESDFQLTITVKSAVFGIKGDKSQYTIIPSVLLFKVMSVTANREPETSIDIVFSDPLAEQNLKGFISFDNITKFTTRIENNKITVYFEPLNYHNFNLTVHAGIKNIEGTILNEDYTVEVKLESLKPAINLINQGNILPNTTNLIVPFRAVNLRAVDIKVIQIYKKNILSFLQENEINGSNNLQRYGRLVYKQTLLLNPPKKNYDKWHNYSLDLSNVFNRESGAIYRIIMTFKKEYSTYPECADDQAIGETSTSRSDKLANNNVISESEQSFWDNPNSYYSDNPDFDWYEYSWSERDNPCHESYYMNSDNILSFNLLSTNIGVIAKQNSDNKIWVSLSDILTTKAISGAEVTIYNYQLTEIGKATTDGDGFAVIQASGKAFVLVAKSGAQQTYLKLVSENENSLSNFDIDGKVIVKGLKGYIYGERGVWRPGDTLHLSFILLDAEKKIPANHPVNLEVYNAEGQFYSSQMSTHGVNGFYVFHLPTNADDGTGIWNAYIKVGGATFHKSLRVETVKPNRLKINLDLGTNRIDANEKILNATLNSAWLTGAKAHDMKFTIEMTLNKIKTQFNGYKDFIFNSPTSNFTTATSEIAKGQTKSDGTANVVFNIPAADNAPGMLNATIVTRVFEDGGDASILSQTIPFSPFESYVGLKTNISDDEYIKTGTNHTFNIVTLSPDGKPVNRSNVEYKIYKIEWSWWWNGDEDVSRYINSQSYKPIAQGFVKTVNGKGSFSYKLAYPEWGRYLVYVVDRESGHATGSIVWIDYDGNDSHANNDNPDDVRMLSFSLDKSEYQVGDLAVVTIPASAGGSALIAMENSSQVLSRKWISIEAKKETKYSFPITSEMMPNCYIHISLLQPYNQTINELPIRMYGVKPMMVSDKNSKLEPQIAVPEVVRPQTEFSINVSEKNRRAMTYTLAIVDDGLLDLTNFKTPNAANEFFAREFLGIRTWDIFDNVIGAFAGQFGSMLKVGGDEELNQNGKKANRFNPVVKFLGPFTLSSGKSNIHKIRLPQYIGSVRVMVVAGQDNAFGNAEKTVIVRSPLMILSSLPRVLSVNEEILLPVNIFAMENDVKNVTVSVKAENGLTQVIDKSKSITFSTPGDKIVYFKIKTSAKTGIEKLSITAQGNGKTATENLEIDVRNPNPAVVISENKILQSGETAEFAYQLYEKQPENWLMLETARIPNVDISRRMDFLYNYEHYCSEQVTSRALPMLYFAKFKTLTSQENVNVKTNVLQAINKLYSRQAANGGFLYWDNSSEPSEWITNYVGHFLIEAKAKSYTINEAVINRWKTYQQREARNWKANTANNYYTESSEYTQAYRLYTLALAGASELGAMNRLKERKTLTLQTRWMLAAAYAIDGKTKVAEELIFNQATTVAKYSNSITYGDNLRDESMILQTLILLNRIDAAFKQAQHISQQLTAEKYFCTQSTAYSLMAMSALAEKSAGEIVYDWSINEKSQKAVTSPKTVVQTELPKTPTSGKISLTNKSKGILYVSLVSKSVPIIDTLPAIANNLQLEISYRDLNGNALKIDKLTQGTDFVSVIQITNTSTVNNYANLALTQIIPAGWEIAPAELQGSIGSTYCDIRDDRVLTYFDLNRGSKIVFSVRLQATYIGNYTLPAIRCQAMYDPEAQARSKAATIEVTQD
ncbi:MAG: alpha-2-macroglobulin [Paludibacter sp.]|jgi:uncharacterized protein YfaS (alpha-2-macroglobulin family)|nr:alpha-2-macroglobulin [Paludibacter sp.]